jgi:ABC-type sugar transport system ATPase subunit
VILGIRPDAFEDDAYAPTALPRIDIEVSVLEELGPEANLIFPIEASPVDAEEVREAADHETETELLADDPRARFVARIDPRTHARVGERHRLAVDPARFHFFDVASGASLTFDGRASTGGVPPG